MIVLIKQKTRTLPRFLSTQLLHYSNLMLHSSDQNSRTKEMSLPFMSQTHPNRVMALYQKFAHLPFGEKLFSMFIARKAPYFATIKPKITALRPNYCECFIKKQHGVHNHIKTVHVIAIANGLEMAMGVMAEASIPKQLRWIPKGMTLDYTAKAGSDIRCVAEVRPEQWQPGDMPVKVSAVDDQGVVVVKGEIKLWISNKPPGKKKLNLYDTK
jgi:acyl-coenzyme A thioesterase PaaI-like protein